MFVSCPRCLINTLLVLKIYESEFTNRVLTVTILSCADVAWSVVTHATTKLPAVGEIKSN